MKQIKCRIPACKKIKFTEHQLFNFYSQEKHLMKINRPITNVEHVMEAVVSEVIDPQGKHLGSVAERQDRTAGIKAEKEAPTILVSAVMSDFTRRIVMQDKTVFSVSRMNPSISLGKPVKRASMKRLLFHVLSHGNLAGKND
jgi:hypothetical protein